MIAALLHLALASSTALQVPAEAPIPPAIATTDVPACVQLTETHFVAISYVDEMQWIVFVNEERGLRRIRGLAPHERALLPIVAGAAGGMSVEIISRSSAGHILTSGSIDCAALTGHTIYFSRKSDELIGWIPRHGGRSLTRAKVGRSVLPEGLARVVRADTAHGAGSFVDPLCDTFAMHVPVPTPGENRKRDKSRRLKRKKLPPV